MDYLKWILLAVCLAGVVWPLLSKSKPSNQESKTEQEEQ